jgi:hypothetical protein
MANEHYRKHAVPNSPTLLVIVVLLGLAGGTLAHRYGHGRIVGLLSLAVLGVVQLTQEQRERGAQRIREALRRADLGIRKAALHMEVDPSDFERALKGEQKLDLWRLEMLPDAFWREYWPLLARDKGAPQIFSTWLTVLPHLFVIEEEKQDEDASKKYGVAAV